MAFSSAAASLVNAGPRPSGEVLRICTWLLNSMTSATSSGLSRLANPTAASCAVASLSSMLLLVSSSRARAIGCWRREKKLTDCLTPSSNTSNSFCSRSVTYLPASVTDTLSETSSTPDRSFGCCWADEAAAPATTQARTTGSRRMVLLAGQPGSRARPEAGFRGRDFDLVGRDQRVGPSVGDDV